MDLISDSYSTVRTWCQGEYLRLGYWLACATSFLGGPPRRQNKQPPCPPNHKPLPDKVPSIIEIKRALPQHCFQPHLPTAFYFVAKDLFLCFVLCGFTVGLSILPLPLLYQAWLPVYWFLQGTMFWAIFVLGHDCGHDSFSSSTMLNDVVGTALHALIMVPYYPWKLSHRHHHKNTGNMDQDEIFYPVRKKDNTNERGFIYGFGLGIGWFIYLITGFTPRKICHFNPFENIYVNNFIGCVCSIASMVGWSYLLYLYAVSFGFVSLLTHYAVPVLVFASWLVIVTFLHHMDVGIEWYSPKRWTYVLGQLSTVDRNYGWAHELTHNIGTHQVHHLFSKIPHYHLEEATDAFRSTFPQLVRQSHERILPAFFRNFTVFNTQRQVENDTDFHRWTDPKLK